jgi:hypothetical protein
MDTQPLDKLLASFVSLPRARHEMDVNVNFDVKASSGTEVINGLRPGAGLAMEPHASHLLAPELRPAEGFGLW